MVENDCLGMQVVCMLINGLTEYMFRYFVQVPTHSEVHKFRDAIPLPVFLPTPLTLPTQAVRIRLLLSAMMKYPAQENASVHWPEIAER
jgi:hypothetical protein